MVSDRPFLANNPLQKTNKNKKLIQTARFRTEIYKRNLPINLVFPGKEDQSRNPISSSRVSYFQDGSACEYTINVKN